MKIKSNTSLSLRKFLLSALVAAPLATLPAPLWALPQTTGGNVTSSSATTTFQTNSPANTVLSITDPVATRLVLRWVNFGSGASSIANGETVIWNLPSSSSGVLNTVTTGQTLIDGALQSNGSIFIMNPNGIILGNTATVTAAGFGLSTINEPEFFFVNNGNLSYSAASPATADVVVGTATINVGSTGSVFLAGRAVDVSGTITAGTLNLTSNNATTGVRLGQAGALTLGAPGTLATLIDPAVPGTGNLIINTNGGPAVLSGASTTNILGGNATITTGGGAITQGAGLFSVGDNVSNSNLTLNTGVGSVTLGNLGGNGQRNNVTLTTGVTSITTNAGTATSLGNTTTGRIALNASTITGNTTINPVALTIVAGGSSIDSAGDVTVTGGTIALTTVAANSGITFKGPGDLVFSTLGTANTTGSGVTLTSTTGSVTLPAAVIGGNLTVTAQTNITQSAGVLTVIGAATNRVASFDAVTGSVTLTNATNDFTRVQIKNAPSGASIVDANSVVIANATNATGAVTISTINGSITFGAAAGETTRFANNLTLNAGAAAAAAATITAGGTGYSATPTVTISAPNSPNGTQATATATVAGGVITAITVVGGS
ncbi:MAG TPA: filamentous hemagglutinin N-terminal domain-containing protein, partial [Opitutaceae bacterium]|nr:filamentous hemagglutinin N-terminal domain-containing protein [Opitutaceae bacterium]